MGPVTNREQGAKSLLFITYQLLTEYCRRLYRWRSYKAYWILNALEVIFWAAVTFLVMQANLSRCVGVSCKLSWVVVGLSVVLWYVRALYFARPSVPDFDL